MSPLTREYVRGIAQVLVSLGAFIVVVLVATGAGD